ncbi:hypothetical protein Esti_004248 [Eimeria stiedai]
MPFISSLALAPILLKTGGATLATTGATTASFAAGTTAAVGGGVAATGGKLLGVAMLTKGVSSAAKSSAFTKAGATAAGTLATHTAAGTAATHTAAAPGLAVTGAGAPAAVLAGPAVVAAPAIVAAGAPAVAATAGAPTLVPTAAGVATAGEVAAAPVGGEKHFTMIATVVGVMVLRALANRYWLNKPAEAKSRLVRRVCRWSKEEEVAVEAEEEFGQIPQLPFKDEYRSYVEAGTGAPNPRRLTREEASRISAARATEAGLTDIETTASTQETRRRRVSYVRRAKGKLHRKRQAF